MGEGVIAWLWVALAADPVADPAPAEPEPYEMTVWGEAAIRQARAEVVREMVDQGWRKGRESDGQIVFKPPASWMGRAVLDYDGSLTFRRPVVAVKSGRVAMPAEPGENPHFDRQVPGGLVTPTSETETAWAAPHPEGTFWVLPSWSVLGPAHEKVLRAVDPALAEYRAVVELTEERSRE